VIGAGVQRETGFFVSVRGVPNRSNFRLRHERKHPVTKKVSGTPNLKRRLGEVQTKGDQE
jgi:hypothetical protein